MRKKAERYSRRTNAQGEISFDIPLAEKQDRERAIEITFKDDLYNYDKTFYVPLLGDRKKEFALSFFPEGGDLLDGSRQRVAFKAQQKTVIVVKYMASYWMKPEIRLPVFGRNMTGWVFLPFFRLPDRNIV